MKDCLFFHLAFTLPSHTWIAISPHFSFSSLYLPTPTAEALHSTPHPNLRIDTGCTLSNLGPPTPDYPAVTTSHLSKSLFLTEGLVIQPSLLHP